MKIVKNSGIKSKMPIRVAIYTRTGVVAGNTNQGLSQDAQRACCVRWCDKRYGAGNYRLSLFADAGFSANLPWEPGPEGRCRPALRDLVEAVSDGQVDVVVVRTLDRLSRSAMLHQRLVEAVLKPHGIALVVTEGNIAPPVV
jgi:DNA invertase Pin-like site-specific DNA recombinase